MAILTNLALLFAAIFAVCCLLLCRLRRQPALHGRAASPPAEEGPQPRADAAGHAAAARLAAAPRRRADPVLQRGPVLRRGVEAEARLDWPRDKLHIQVLDDSTDETAELARTVVAELQAQGLDVVALQRTDRSGFQGRRPA